MRLGKLTKQPEKGNLKKIVDFFCTFYKTYMWSRRQFQGVEPWNHRQSLLPWPMFLLSSVVAYVIVLFIAFNLALQLNLLAGFHGGDLKTLRDIENGLSSNVNNVWSDFVARKLGNASRAALFAIAAITSAQFLVACLCSTSTKRKPDGTIRFHKRAFVFKTYSLAGATVSLTLATLITSVALAGTEATFSLLGHMRSYEFTGAFLAFSLIPIALVCIYYRRQNRITARCKRLRINPYIDTLFNILWLLVFVEINLAAAPAYEPDASLTVPTSCTGTPCQAYLRVKNLENYVVDAPLNMNVTVSDLDPKRPNHAGRVEATITMHDGSPVKVDSDAELVVTISRIETQCAMSGPSARQLTNFSNLTGGLSFYHLKSPSENPYLYQTIHIRGGVPLLRNTLEQCR